MITTENAARMCPRCGGESSVYRCSERNDGVFVRRRLCKSCGAEFETLEVFSGYVKKSAISDSKKRKSV